MGCAATTNKHQRKVAPAVQIESDVQHLKQKVLSPEGGKAFSEAADESICIWVGTHCVDGHLPSRSAISELLYGDSGNSARGADVVALFLTDLRISKENVSELRGLLKSCMEDSERYIFNDIDPGLAIAGVPAQLTSMNEDGAAYVAMYVGVHQRFGGSGSNSKPDLDGMVLPSPDEVTHPWPSTPSKCSRLTDVFPTPPFLVCGEANLGERADEYSLSKSVMLQDVLLWPPSHLSRRWFMASSDSGLGGSKALNKISSNRSAGFSGQVPPLHLLLCGANLSDEFRLQWHQLHQLTRHIDVRYQKTNPFSVAIFGHFNHRIVCGQEFRPHVQEFSISKKKGPSTQCWALKDSGVDDICRRLSDPVARQKLFLASSLHFTGVDCFGRSHNQPPLCSQALTTLFETNHDWVQRSGSAVPLLTQRRTPVHVLLTQALGFDIEMPESVTLEQLTAGANTLRVPQTSVEDLMELYFPPTPPKTKTHSRVLKKNLGEALYMQVGWSDGIGVYRQGSCKAEIASWDSLEDVVAFDHVPVKGCVRVLPNRKPPLRVWTGYVKLENRFPSKEALRHLLYDGPGASALGADVIALCFTDLEVTPHTSKKLQNLLYNAMSESERQYYIFNEQEEALAVRAIPVQLLKTDSSTGKPRYMALHVCVRRQLVGDSESSLKVGVEDAFLSPPELICRSDMKNDAGPNFKAHMAQTVVLKSCNSLHLVLVGLNFDTEDMARARQVERLERYLQAYRDQDRHFAAVIFGDFNNRLVCPDWLAQHVSWHGEGQVRGPVLKIDGARQLCSMLAVPAKRLEIMRQLDSWFFDGVDAAGRAISVPTACQRLKELFHLHIDLPLDEGNIPLPSYKRSPLGEVLSRQVGFPVSLPQLLTRAQLDKGFQKLRGAINDGNLLQDVKVAYFGNANEQRRIKVAGAPGLLGEAGGSRLLETPDTPDPEEDGDGSPDAHSQGPPMLDCGWPDSVGVYKHGVQTRAEITAWGICDKVLGSFEQVPMRATLRVHRVNA